MKIIKKINTSAAVALDSSGSEVVVLGKGIGFPKVPYELSDLSIIERTFYEVDHRYFNLIESVPKEILIAAAEISEEAELELDCRLNPSLPFTLADHISFAITRMNQSINLTSFITYDIHHIYPKETQLAFKALKIVESHTGYKLPESEITSIAMHLINAEAESGSIDTLIKKINIIKDIERIIQSNLGIYFNHESYIYSRFIIHIQFLLDRLERNAPAVGHGDKLMKSIVRDYPTYYQCVLEVSQYLKSEHGWTCTEDEKLYLMLHIIRVADRQN